VPQFIEPDIVIPAFKGALEQISRLSLAKLGLDITELPFWLAIIGFPLAVFETCTKHIATALNVLLRKVHINLQAIAGMFLPIFVLALLIILLLFFGYREGVITRSVREVELTQIFYYLILFLGGMSCCLFIASLSRLTGQGNYVTGIGFIMGALSIYIEVVQEYGLIGQISCLAALSATVGLWIYGRNYNLRLEKPNEPKTQPAIPPISDRHSRTKRLNSRRFEK